MKNLKAFILSILASEMKKTTTEGQFRFNKISNFLSYDEYLLEMAKDAIIKLGKELEAEERFKDDSDDDLKKYSKEFYDTNSADGREDAQSLMFIRNRGIQAGKELERRQLN